MRLVFVQSSPVNQISESKGGGVATILVFTIELRRQQRWKLPPPDLYGEEPSLCVIAVHRHPTSLLLDRQISITKSKTIVLWGISHH